LTDCQMLFFRFARVDSGFSNKYSLCKIPFVEWKSQLCSYSFWKCSTRCSFCPSCSIYSIFSQLYNYTVLKLPEKLFMTCLIT
jgi:hypothetical protein